MMIFIILTIFVTINLTQGQLPPLPTGPKHPCDRTCTGNIWDRKTCNYEFRVEWYQTLSSACFQCPQNINDCFRPECIPADGFPRPVQTVNRMMPGPKIEVCQGDIVSVKVHNEQHSESTTVHWHGQHQKGTQYMDGVPFVTQCPINPETTFHYLFRATQAGTHFWHSHSGIQRANGHFGSLIARKPKTSADSSNYDFDLSEHVMVLSDWTEHEANEVFVKRYYDSTDENPRSLLVNGLGRFTNIVGATPIVPAARFVVTRGKKYRFRLIGSSFMDDPIMCSIDGHQITVIASDGEDVKPVITDSLTIFAGERYDIVVNANQANALYWMRFQGLIQGELGQTFQAAVLQYAGQSGTTYPPGPAPTYATSGRVGKQVNGVNLPPNNTPVNALVPVVATPSNLLMQNPDYQIYVTFDIKAMLDPRFQLYSSPPNTGNLPLTDLPQFNGISLKLFTFPLLSQRNEIDVSQLCNGDTVPASCATEFCSCAHVIKFQTGKTVEVVIVDEGKLFDVSHPIHLHGQFFAVVGHYRYPSNQTTESQVWQDDINGRIRRNLINPPLKDTVTVPDGGYTVIRFRTDNPGFWLMHCHIEFHMELGMGLAFQVGEYSQMPPVPAGFPRCGDYTNPPTPPL